MDTTTANCERVAKDAKESAYCDDACYGRCRICPGQASKAAAALLLALAAERDALREALVKSRKDCVEKISRIPAGDYDSCLDRMMRRFNAALKEPT